MKLGRGLIFSYGGLEKDLICSEIEFESPTELNGLSPNLSQFPGLLIANTLRKNSKIQNQT
jgi:hypothetical protein